MKNIYMQAYVKCWRRPNIAKNKSQTGKESLAVWLIISLSSLAQRNLRWLSGHAIQAQTQLLWYPRCEKSTPVFAIRNNYVYKYMLLKKRINIAETQKKVKREDSLGAVRLGELLGDFIELYSSAETSLALWPCSPGSNPIECDIALVDKSILVFAIHDEYIQICIFNIAKEGST